MNRDEAIQWCRDFLPKWPDLAIGNIGSPINFSQLARPKGWYWVFTAERVSLTKSGEYIYETDVFPPAAAPPPMDRAQAIQWCEYFLPEWPNGDNKALILSKLARPIGWYWNYMTWPNEKGYVINLLSRKDNECIDQSEVVAPPPPPDR